jgi:hypothetical protein
MVPIEYSNRRGKTYYLREGKTKTGKLRYFFSSRENGKGKAVDKVPEGYEIYEHPENAQVFLRKKRSRLITDIEEQFVKKSLNTLKRSRRYLVDCKDEYITIYESNADTEILKGILGDLLSIAPTRPGVNTDDAMTALVNAADQHYTPMLRFCLNDKEKRTFVAQRFCFRGSIDEWIYLAGPDDFESIVKKSVSILGTDEFFDTPYF